VRDGWRGGPAFLLAHQPPCGIEQQGPEDVLHRRKAIEQRNACHDKQRAEHDGAEHAVDQRAMLLANREPEAAKQDKKNKEVVD
jgi:hypothetical protein